MALFSLLVLLLLSLPRLEACGFAVPPLDPGPWLAPPASERPASHGCSVFETGGGEPRPGNGTMPGRRPTAWGRMTVDERSRRLTVILEKDSYTVELRQVFFNTGRKPVEFSFALPMPRGAVLERSSPALLTPATGRVLDMALAMASRKGFPHLLSCLDGSLAVSKPVSVAPHRPWVATARWRARPIALGKELFYLVPFAARGPMLAPIRRVTVSIRTKGGLADRLQCLSHELLPPLPRSRWAYTAIRATDTTPEEDILLNVLLARRRGVLSMAACRDGHGTWVRGSVFLPPVDEKRARKLSKRAVLFLVDVSGSLYGARLEEVKKGLLTCLDSLGPGDYFNIVPFALIPRSFHHEFLPAVEDSVEAGKNYVKSLKGMGGTNLGETIQHAAELMAAAPPGLDRCILLFTDGKADVGMIEPRRLAKLFRQTMPGNCRLEVIALGCNVDSRLLASMARFRNGSLVFADDEKSASALLAERLEATVREYPSIELSVTAGGKSVFYRTNAGNIRPGREPLLMVTRLPAVQAADWTGGGRQGAGEGGLGVEMSVNAKDLAGRVSASSASAEVDTLLLPLEGLAENVRCLMTAPAVAAMVESVERPRTVPRLPPWEEARLRRILRLPSGKAERLRLADIAGTSGPDARRRHRMVRRLLSQGTFLPRPYLRESFRRVGGRIFARTRSGAWAEEPRPTGEERRVLYCSRPWFELVEKRPDLRPVLGLGRKVLFGDRGVVYRVVP